LKHLFLVSSSHYDVVAASSQSSWLNPPFELTGLNGYLYGRGASDNKGPLLASAWAVAGLQSNGELDMDVVFLVEGEEEAGSGGFAESVGGYKAC
jgi:di- and tripeptidase